MGWMTFAVFVLLHIAVIALAVAVLFFAKGMRLANERITKLEGDVRTLYNTKVNR